MRDETGERVQTVMRTLGSHQRSQLPVWGTYEVRCICGFEADGASYTDRMYQFRRHVAEAVVAEDSGSNLPLSELTP